MNDTCLREKNGYLLVRVRVKPRSSREGIEGVSPDGELIVRLTAPPVDNKANAALIALIAKTLGVPKAAVSVATGAKGRSKTVRVEATTIRDARARLSIPE